MEQIRAFIEKAKTDKELMAKLNTLESEKYGTAEIIALAAEYGFAVTTEEIEQAAKASGTQELKEGELGEIAGGAPPGIEDNDTQPCRFTWTGKEKPYKGEQWLECASSFLACLTCRCFGKEHCKDRWHAAHSDNLVLAPQNFANHLSKQMANKACQ